MNEGVDSPAIRIDPDATFERIMLDDSSWVDVARNWVVGADDVFDHLLQNVRWQTTQLFRYEQYVEERRLSSGWRRGRPLPHPVLADATRAIQLAGDVLRVVHSLLDELVGGLGA